MDELENKRIYELTTTADTQNRGVMVDKDGDPEATFTPLTYHVVSTLPASPNAQWIYYLTATDNLYPKGVYKNNGTGYSCIQQDESISLTSWTGTVSEELTPGVVYNVTVSGAVTNISITLETIGSVIIIVNNTSAYAIANPSGIYKRTSSGIDDIATNLSEWVISFDGTNYLWSCIERLTV